MLRLSLVLALLATPATLLAQGNPVSKAVRKSAGDNGKNLLAAARAMPADKYNYKPVEAFRERQPTCDYKLESKRARKVATGGWCVSGTFQVRGARMATETRSPINL